MTAHHIRYDVDADGIATITIDRPEKRNAMTYAMLNAFIEKVAQAGADDAVRVLDRHRRRRRLLRGHRPRGPGHHSGRDPRRARRRP